MDDRERQKIRGRIDREYWRSIAKHGNWDDLFYSDMASKIVAEFEEALDAFEKKDHFGKHGTFNELAQVAACCEKLMVQILRRQQL